MVVRLILVTVPAAVQQLRLYLCSPDLIIFIIFMHQLLMPLLFLCVVIFIIYYYCFVRNRAGSVPTIIIPFKSGS
jgi:hypothetical protein